MLEHEHWQLLDWTDWIVLGCFLSCMAGGSMMTLTWKRGSRSLNVPSKGHFCAIFSAVEKWVQQIQYSFIVKGDMRMPEECGTVLRSLWHAFMRPQVACHFHKTKQFKHGKCGWGWGHTIEWSDHCNFSKQMNVSHHQPTTVVSKNRPTEGSVLSSKSTSFLTSFPFDRHMVVLTGGMHDDLSLIPAFRWMQFASFDYSWYFLISVCGSWFWRIFQNRPVFFSVAML